MERNYTLDRVSVDKSECPQIKDNDTGDRKKDCDDQNDDKNGGKNSEERKILLFACDCVVQIAVEEVSNQSS